MQRELSAKLTEGLSNATEITKREGEVSNNPSVTASRATSPYTGEAYGETRLRVASNNCMAGRPI